MTLAIHGKSTRRKAALGLAALLAVAVALLAGFGSFTPSPRANAQTEGGTGSITIVKQGLVGSDVATFTDDIPADTDGTFDLSVASNSIVFDGLAGGTYHVTEAPLAGYSLTGVGCAIDSSFSRDAAPLNTGNTLAIVLAEGQHLTCTFVNAQAQTAQHTVTVVKYVDGGLATDGSFDLSDGAGPFMLDSSNSFSHSVSVDAGSAYAVSETGIDGTCDPGDSMRLAGYGIGASLAEAAAATPVDAASLTNLQTDEWIVVQNERCAANSGSITIVKQGLTEGVTADFTDDVSAGGTFSLDMTNDSQTFQNLPAGDYHFTELALDGWKLVSAGCAFSAAPLAPTATPDTTLTVTLGEGEHITCTFVNAPIPKQFTVTTVKYVDGALASGGSFDFTASTGDFTLDSANAWQSVSDRQDAGAAVSVSENGIDSTCDEGDTYRLAGYGIGATLDAALTATPVAAATIADLQSDEFIVVWNQACANLGTVTIEKDFQPDSAAMASFTATGSGVADFSILEGAGNGKLFGDLNAGAYTFTEAFMGGMRLDQIACTGTSSPSDTVIDIPSRSLTLNLKAGEHVVCTFTNVADASVRGGKITIIKQWDAAGTPTTFNTTGIVGLPGNQFVLDDTNAGNEMHAFDNLEAGSYTFAEVKMDGWQLMAVNCTGQLSPSDLGINLGGATLTVNLEAGQEITCTFSNHATATTPTAGSITVTKVADPDTALSWTFSATGAGLTSPFTLSTGGGTATTTTANLTPGAYTVTEDAVDGWTLTNIACTGGASASGDTSTRTATITLAAGEAVVCTFTNTQNTTVATTNPLVPTGVIEVPGALVPQTVSEPSTAAPADVTLPATGEVPQPNTAVEGVIAPAPGANPATAPQSNVVAPEVAAAATPAAPETGSGYSSNPASVNWTLVIAIALLSGGVAVLTAAKFRNC